MEIDAAPFARGDHVELAQRVVAKLRAASPTTFTDGAFYQYDDRRGIFRHIEPAELSRIVQSFAGAMVKAKPKPKPLRLRKTDVRGASDLAADQIAESDFFCSARRGVAFADRFVEVTGRRLAHHEHAPENRARFAYDFGFVDNAQPRRLLEFFGEVFRDDTDAQAKAALLQEYAGISLLGLATRFQKALVLNGPGANGKGVVSSIIEQCMPPGSVAAIAPRNVGQEYRRALLAGKLIDIVAELPEADILDAESWKSVVAGDTMTGRDIRKAPFSFRPVAGHIYSANRLPGTADQTHGFWRRLVVIEFNRVFAEHEQNPYLAQEIVEHEKPAIVGWLLAGAQRVLAAGKLTMPASSDDLKQQWQTSADQVRAYIEDNVRRLPLDAPTYEWTPATTVYRFYKAWAANNGHRPVAANKFGERMRLLGLPSKSTGRARCYPVELGHD